MNEKYKSALEISQVHIDRINTALDHLKSSLPLTEENVKSLQIEDLVYLELLTNRFAKLQDFMGNTMFDMCIEKLGDVTDGLTVIDKVNKMVKARIIDSESVWREFRKARNHISHEYPNRPDLVAKYINETINLIPELLKCAANIHKCLSS